MSCQNCSGDLRTDGHIHCATCHDTGSISDFCFVCFADRVEVRGHRADHDYYVIEGLEAASNGQLWNPAEKLRLLDAVLKVGVGSWDATAKLVKTKSPIECGEEFLEQYSLAKPQIPPPALTTLLLEIVAPQPPSVPDLHGYLPKRGDFDLEYDDGAELAVADLDFSDGSDTALKMEALRAYAERVAFRHKVKKFAIERAMTSSQSFTPAEIEMHAKLAPLNRFFESGKDFDQFINLSVQERRILDRLNELHQESEGSMGEIDVSS
jgi:transcriptional adapter 2-alpha